MYNGKKIFCLIPARGGSKGIPDKNIRILGDKPLVAWSIEAAKGSKYVDYIYVSTDDKRIAKIAEKYGANTEPLRPKELATDESVIMDTVVYTINYFESHGEKYDILVLIQATSPFTTTADIDNAIEILFEKKGECVVSLCESEYHPYWMNTLPPDGNMKDFLKPEIVDLNRQDLPKYYRLTGSIFIATTDYLKKYKSFFGDKTYAYILPQERSIDIDKELDWLLAEAYIKLKSHK